MGRLPLTVRVKCRVRRVARDSFVASVAGLYRHDAATCLPEPPQPAISIQV